VAGFPSVAKGNKLGEKAKRPHAGVPLDENVIAELITKCHGNLSRVADTIGSARGCIRRVIDKHPYMQELLKQARERQLDQLEQCVFDRAMESNDTTLQLFLLKTQGKSRGYDQSEAQHAAKDIATAAFDYILGKANQSKPTPQA